jgi:hypothetical protein
MTKVCAGYARSAGSVAMNRVSAQLVFVALAALYLAATTTTHPGRTREIVEVEWSHGHRRALSPSPCRTCVSIARRYRCTTATALWYLIDPQNSLADGSWLLLKNMEIWRLITGKAKVMLLRRG